MTAPQIIAALAGAIGATSLGFLLGAWWATRDTTDHLDHHPEDYGA